MNAITEGVHDIPAAAYHADPCPAPSLSSSIARTLLSRSPLHGWKDHPRLNPNYKAVHSTVFDIGSAAHALMLQNDDARFAIIHADDYRSKTAQAARDAAYAAGSIPLLPHQYDQVFEMVCATREQLAGDHESADAFTAGKPERTLVWREGDAWCRAMLDWLPDSPTRATIIYDYKSTTNAEPDAWSRTKLTSLGYDVQAAFYLRGLRALGYPDALRFAFVVIEVEPPYAVSVVGLPPVTIALADQKVAHAIRVWRECLTTDKWPAYPRRICWAEPPPWDEARWGERMAREDRPPAAALKAAMEWQRPIERTDA